jgi:hypothetical protein
MTRTRRAIAAGRPSFSRDENPAACDLVPDGIEYPYMAANT